MNRNTKGIIRYRKPVRISGACRSSNVGGSTGSSSSLPNETFSTISVSPRSGVKPTVAAIRSRYWLISSGVQGSDTGVATPSSSRLISVLLSRITATDIRSISPVGLTTCRTVFETSKFTVSSSLRKSPTPAAWGTSRVGSIAPPWGPGTPMAWP